MYTCKYNYIKQYHVKRSSVIKDSYIYFIRNLETKRIKVGYSQKPLARLNDLRVGSDCDLRLEMTIPVFSRRAKFWEAALHEALAEYHVRGEWFAVPDDVFKHTIAVYKKLLWED